MQSHISSYWQPIFHAAFGCVAHHGAGHASFSAPSVVSCLFRIEKMLAKGVMVGVWSHPAGKWQPYSVPLGSSTDASLAGFPMPPAFPLSILETNKE